jgi:hypothetical protein
LTKYRRPRAWIARRIATSGPVSLPLLLRMLARVAGEEAQDSRFPIHPTLDGAPAGARPERKIG